MTMKKAIKVKRPQARAIAVFVVALAFTALIAVSSLYPPPPHSALM